jgi:hypothetical protein
MDLETCFWSMQHAIFKTFFGLMMGKKMDIKRAFHESHLKNMGPKISKNLIIFYEL